MGTCEIVVKVQIDFLIRIITYTQVTAI